MPDYLRNIIMANITIIRVTITATIAPIITTALSPLSGVL